MREAIRADELGKSDKRSRRTERVRDGGDELGGVGGEGREHEGDVKGGH